VALALIWSFVGYSFFWPNNATMQPLKTSNEFIQENELPFEKNPFVLVILNRDPYLNSRVMPIKKTENMPKGRPKSDSKNIKTVWPNIAYFGFVKSNDQSAPLVLLTINNKLKRLRQGEKFEKILVKKVFRDSVHIQLGKEVKSFVKN